MVQETAIKEPVVNEDGSLDFTGMSSEETQSFAQMAFNEVNNFAEAFKKEVQKKQKFIEIISPVIIPLIKTDFSKIEFSSLISPLLSVMTKAKMPSFGKKEENGNEIINEISQALQGNGINIPLPYLLSLSEEKKSIIVDFFTNTSV